MNKFMWSGVNKFKAVFILFTVSLFFMACTKSKFKWVNYDETVCNDKWDQSINNERLKDNITSFLKTKGVKVLEIEIYNNKPAESCLECGCKTGRTVKCKVKKNDLKNAKSEGFYE